MSKEYKLSDNVVVNIVQLLQLSMLTGTDISDHFRLIRLEESTLDKNKLELSSDYVKNHNKMIKTLVGEAEALSQQIANKGEIKFQ